MQRSSWARLRTSTVPNVLIILLLYSPARADTKRAALPRLCSFLSCGRPRRQVLEMFPLRLAAHLELDHLRGPLGRRGSRVQPDQMQMAMHLGLLSLLKAHAGALRSERAA